MPYFSRGSSWERGGARYVLRNEYWTRWFLFTGHANTITSMMSSIETSGAKFLILLIRQQISSAIDIIIHLCVSDIIYVSCCISETIG